MTAPQEMIVFDPIVDASQGNITQVLDSRVLTTLSTSPAGSMLHPLSTGGLTVSSVVPVKLFSPDFLDKFLTPISPSDSILPVTRENAN